LVQAFLKNWWVESDFKAPNLPLSLRFKGKKNVKNMCLSMCDVKVFLTFTFTEYGTVLTTVLPILFLYLNTVIVTAGAFENNILFSAKHRTNRVITKLPNSEQSYKGKVKTHNYINRQNQSTTGKL
jgi:hypothetical protein